MFYHPSNVIQPTCSKTCEPGKKNKKTSIVPLCFSEREIFTYIYHKTRPNVVKFLHSAGFLEREDLLSNKISPIEKSAWILRTTKPWLRLRPLWHQNPLRIGSTKPVQFWWNGEGRWKTPHVFCQEVCTKQEFWMKMKTCFSKDFLISSPWIW